MKPTARLENWEWDGRHNVIWGSIYDDVRKRWPEGTRIHTSYIADEDADGFLMEGEVIKTLNSTYLLGKPL